MVTLYHPALDRTIEVHERTVRIWERRGWQRPKPRKRPPAVETAADPAEDQPPTPTTED